MSIDNPEVLKELSDKLTESVKKMSLIKESFIFDYFENKKLDIMKVGYRFKFQTEDKSLTDKEVDGLMKVLTDIALSINGVNIEDYKLSYIFTSESVSEGHLTRSVIKSQMQYWMNVLKQDKQSRVACETLVKNNTVVLAGEISSKASIDHEKIARDVVKNIGYVDQELGLVAKVLSLLIFYPSKVQI